MVVSDVPYSDSDPEGELPDDIAAARIAEIEDEFYGWQWWVPADAETAWRWVLDQETQTYRITGLIFYGDVTAERLGSLRVTKGQRPLLTPLAERYATRLPPTQEHLAEYAAAVKAEVESQSSVPQWVPRGQAEPMDQFLKRVALVFRQLQKTNLPNTTTALADLADVPFTTAVFWVREARKRGYLPESRRQQARKRKGSGNGQ